MLMSIASLILLIIWNLMPDYTYFDYYPFGKFVWRECVEEILSIQEARNGFHQTLKKIVFILVPLLCLLTIIMIPIWKIWQSSLLLRIIAGIMMLSGMMICFLYLFSFRDSNYFYQVRLFATNFLTTALALLLFKNETSHHRDQFVTSGKKFDLS